MRKRLLKEIKTKKNYLDISGSWIERHNYQGDNITLNDL